MNWREKDKEVRDVLVKRLFLLREKMNELLHKIEKKCKLKEAEEVLSLIKKIDNCLDLVRFTNYGYEDFSIKNYSAIEEKQREIFERLSEIEKILDIDFENPDFTSHIKKGEFFLQNLENNYNEIKSLIMAFVPPRKEVEEEVL